MEPNAGDIYGLQQQQRRMSKSNSRAHRMSVATGIRLIQLKKFSVKKFKKYATIFGIRKPIKNCENFKF